jgi:hypothetical protein
MGARITMNAAVGPVTCRRDPPSAATRKPATIAVYSPFWGAAPTAIASAIASGRATIPTTTPASTSARSSARPYPSRRTDRKAAAGRSFHLMGPCPAWYRVLAIPSFLERQARRDDFLV